MRGLPEGGFAKPEAILDVRGQVLRVGQFWQRGEPGKQGSWERTNQPHGTAAAPMDWNGNGRTDLLLGTSCGRIFVARNVGSEQGLRFDPELVPLDVGGKPLELKEQYAMPFAVDWDGDGLMDILVGTLEGSVLWLRSTGEAGSGRFEPPRTLVGPSSGEWDAPGRRVQVSAADVDGDGHLDLLIGDYLGYREDGQHRARGHVWWLRRLPPE